MRGEQISSVSNNTYVLYLINNTGFDLLKNIKIEIVVTFNM